MNLFDLAGPEPIETMPLPRGRDGLLSQLRERRPVLLSDVRESLPFTRSWNYRFFRGRLSSIRIQRPSPDGIYHYLGFTRVPMDEFDDILNNGRDAYALEPLRGRGSLSLFPATSRWTCPSSSPRRASGYQTCISAQAATLPSFISMRVTVFL